MLTLLLAFGDESHRMSGADPEPPPSIYSIVYIIEVSLRSKYLDSDSCPAMISPLLLTTVCIHSGHLSRIKDLRTCHSSKSAKRVVLRCKSSHGA